jgi:hypothetical protein
MSREDRCHCARCTIRSLTGPAILITVGVLFLLQETRGGMFNLNHTFPVILVVVGAILLASSLAPMEGHMSAGMPQPPVTPSANPPSGPRQEL